MKLHYNYKDIFKSIRLAFSLKKLAIMTISIFVAFIFYNIFSYLALLISGYSFNEIWHSFRFFPFLTNNLPYYSYILWIIGIISFLIIFFIAQNAVAKITFEQLRGDEFFEIKESLKFAFKNFKSYFFSPLFLIAFIILIIIAGIILALIGKIPYFGDIFVGIMSIPAFCASIFILYLLIILFFSLILSPIIVGCTNSDTFDTLFEVFSCVNEQPARLIWYSIILKVLSFLGFLIFGYATFISIKIGKTILSILIPDKINEAFSLAHYFIKISPPENTGFYYQFWSNLIERLGLFYLLEPNISFIPNNWGIAVLSIFFALTFYLLYLFVLSYGVNIWTTGQTLVYLNLVKKKDDRDLLEEKEEKEEIITPTEEKKEEQPKEEG
ncbi:MAG: hypothetical protein N2323_00985 [candidate division WOR-3 bacterium]|nr:hypothetical protein [candidate division WOR-3 bacterium]MCX7836520.1 hypothetical protein [candidate division WOR-3 bacterium]MDW8113758.1 hypothetical protein [candidate division WOR-3 bacterium]